MTQNVADHIKYFMGPCSGMTVMEFEKPRAVDEDTAKPQNSHTQVKVEPHDSFESCGRNQIPYESFWSEFPGVCSVFCVPVGDCESLLQTGYLSEFHIMAQGNCKEKGY